MSFFDILKKLLGGSDPVPPIIPPRRGPAVPGPSAIPPIIGGAQRPAQPSKPKGKDLNLDPGQFAPLSNDEVKKKARGIGSLWGNPWFGRRDLIPPVTDARTALIDGAMVGQGLITPEELAEIHDVGAQMETIRPDLAVAREMADAAVKRSEEERAKLKEQRKAEAAARKQRHIESVARRKQTDIVFLGRGVSGGLADRRANVEKLQRLQLPVLASPDDVSKALAVPIARLRWLAFHSEASNVTHYVRFQVPKKSGGTRELAAPHRDLARCQEWILRQVLEKIPVAGQAHGFVPGRSTMSNAVPHVGQQVIVNVDLKDFFPTVTFPRVKGIFQELGFSPAVSTIFALLCTESPRRTVEFNGKKLHVSTGPRALPQGACTSPALSNLVARKADSRLAGLAKKLGFVYTRYADDITFSGSGESAKHTAYLLARIRHIAQDENFTVNEKKTRVQRPGRQQTVTGIVVNKRPNVPRKVTRRMRAILHQAKKGGLAAQNREGRAHFTSWVGGMISYIHMVNPSQGKKLRDAFDGLPE